MRLILIVALMSAASAYMLVPPRPQPLQSPAPTIRDTPFSDIVREQENDDYTYDYDYLHHSGESGESLESEPIQLSVPPLELILLYQHSNILHGRNQHYGALYGDYTIAEPRSETQPETRPETWLEARLGTKTIYMSGPSDVLDLH